MTKFLTAILLVISLFHEAHAGAIMIVQSVRVKPYEDAVEGFESVVGSRVEKMVLSETEEADLIGKIEKNRPDAILAVGSASLDKVRSIRGIPIIYLMVLNPDIRDKGNKDMTGVIMNIHPRTCLEIISKMLPGIKRTGLLYDPLKSGDYVEHAQAETGNTGLRLEPKTVENPKSVSSALNGMKGNIDAFWMLPDTTVLTPETIEFLFLFSFQNKIPIITFSDKYAEMGAVLSIGIDAFDMGCQAGEMAKKILKGGNVPEARRVVYARKAVVTANLKIAGKMGIKIHTDIAGNIRIID